MSELALTTSSPVPAPELRWLTVQACAQLMGVTERQITRRCGEEWQGQAKAKIVQEPGKKPQWMIKSDADPRLTPGAVVKVGTSDEFKRFSKKLQDQALARKAILDRWSQTLYSAMHMNMTRDQATDALILTLTREAAGGACVEVPSRPKLYRWQKAFDDAGLVGLIDRRAARHVEEKFGGGGGEDPFLSEILENWLQQTQPSIIESWRAAKLVAGRRGWEVRSYDAAKRHIDAYGRANQDVVVLRREGPDAFKNKCAAHVTRDYSPLESNEMWNADHHEVDVFVKVGEKLNPATGEMEPVHARPWLTAWQDLRSRKIVGWIIRARDPNTDAIIGAFNVAVKSHHVPLTVYTDNGKDFDSRALTGETKKMRWKRRRVKVVHDQGRLIGVWGRLQIKHIHAMPYHGQSKPIERFFRTLEERFGKSFETYCGSTAQDRPEQLGDKLDRGRAPELALFIEQFAQWVEVAYNQHPHLGDGVEGAWGDTPSACWQANLKTIHTATEEEIDLATQRPYGPYSVGQNGVMHKGLGFGQHELYRFAGRKVFIAFDGSLDRCRVMAEDGKFLCVATANIRLPANATPEMLNNMLPELARENRIRREAARLKPRMAVDMTDRLIEAAAEESARRPASAAGQQPTVTAIQTGLKGVANFARSGVLKKAAGAEGMGGVVGFDIGSLADESPVAVSPKLSITDFFDVEG